MPFLWPCHLIPILSQNSSNTYCRFCQWRLALLHTYARSPHFIGIPGVKFIYHVTFLPSIHTHFSGIFNDKELPADFIFSQITCCSDHKHSKEWDGCDLLQKIVPLDYHIPWDFRTGKNAKIKFGPDLKATRLQIHRAVEILRYIKRYCSISNTPSQKKNFLLSFL